MTARTYRLLLAATAIAGAALAVGLVVGGAATTVEIAGLPDAGTVTRWGLPVARLGADLSAVTTVGMLLMAAVLLPSTKGPLSPEARGYARLASWAALSWTGTTALTMLFTLSDLLAVPATGLSGTVIVSFVTTIPQGTMLPLVLILSGCVAGYARGVVSVHGTAGLLAVTLLTLLPPVLTGHSASSPNHSMAITGLGLHLVALALWTGGLAAVTVHALRGRADLALAAGRFSRPGRSGSFSSSFSRRAGSPRTRPCSSACT
ncbi:hypothetical protein ABZ912_26710 [Nonomuraea angiospora]|uniref:hypothetical protein n=1 Tax=Nonomuraea angiospora TaxID=46172 RepID=UPI0033DAAD04